MEASPVPFSNISYQLPFSSRFCDGNKEEEAEVGKKEAKKENTNTKPNWGSTVLLAWLYSVKLWREEGRNGEATETKADQDCKYEAWIWGSGAESSSVKDHVEVREDLFSFAETEKLQDILIQTSGGVEHSLQQWKCEVGAKQGAHIFSGA